MADDQPDRDDLAARLAGAMGAGEPDARRPVSLTEALYQRIVDVTRQEVSQTTEVLGEVIVQIGRLERRLNAVASHFEAEGMPAASGDGGAGLAERLERLEAVLSRVEAAGGGAPAGGAGPAVEARLDELADTLNLALERMEALGSTGGGDLRAVSDLIDRRLGEIGSGTGSADAGEVGQVISRGLAEIRTALLTAQPDLTPIVRSVNQSFEDMRAELVGLGRPDGDDHGSTALDELRGSLAEMRDAIERVAGEVRDNRPEPPGPDPEITAAVHRLDERLAALGQLPEEIARLDRLVGEVADGQSGLTDRLTPELEALASTLRAEVAALRAALPAHDPPDLRPVIEAVHSQGSAIRDELAHLSPDLDLGPVLGALAELQREVLAAGSVDLSPVLDRVTSLGQVVEAGLQRVRDSQPEPVDPDALAGRISTETAESVRSALAGTTAELAGPVQDLQASIAAMSARYAAKIDELRDGLADDSERLAARIDAAAERQTPPDLTPVLEAIERASDQSSVLEALERAGDHSTIVAAVEAAASESRQAVHEAVAAMAATADRLEQAGDRPVDLDPILVALDQATSRIRSSLPEPVDLGPLQAELAGQRDFNEATAANLRAAIEQAVGALRDSQADQTERLIHSQTPPEPVDLGPVLARLEDLGAEVGRLSELSTAIDAVAARLDRPTEPVDLSPVIEAVRSAAADVSRQVHEARPDPTDLEPVLGAIREAIETADDARRAATDQGDRLVAAVEASGERADSRSSDLVARIDRLAGEMRDATPPPPDLGPVLAALDSLRSDATTASEREAEAAVTRAEQLEQTLRSTVEALHGRIDELAGPIGRITDKVESRQPDEELLAEVRHQLDRLAGEMNAVRMNVDPTSLQGAFASSADAAAARLAESAQQIVAGLNETTEGVLARIDRRDSQMSSLKVDLESAVKAALSEADQRQSITALERVVDSGLTDLATAVGTDLGRVNAGLSALDKDLAATRERILELDRNLTGMRAEVAGTAEVAQASYQTADTLQAMLPAIASLENRTAAQLDDLAARLDALAALVADRVPEPATPGERQTKVALGVGTRLDAIREVAAGVGEAIRNDRRKRRARSLGSGSGSGRG